MVCGGLRWFVVVCGSLRWFAMVCRGLSFTILVIPVFSSYCEVLGHDVMNCHCPALPYGQFHRDSRYIFVKL